MFTTIINDCRDDNARARQESRLASLLGTPLSFVGVQSDLEAGLQLIDILDATEGRPGLILVNVAPRGGHTTKWENGTPFAYFRYQETLIVSSVDGYVLSGVKKFGLTTSVQLLDTHSAAATMAATGFVTAAAAARIPTTQFRSFDFTPRVGAFLFGGGDVPTEEYSLGQVPNLPAAVWHIDNFGNCKTTLTATDLADASELVTRFGTLPHIKKLRDLPDGHHALVSGSSGLGDTRFLELMAQRQNFAKHHDVHLGDDLFSPTSHFRQATE
jgi:hypothetical protein